MKKLQLSEAILLGSLLMAEPAAGRTTTCAVGMALLAHGVEPRGLRDYERLMGIHPWLRDLGVSQCPWCATKFPAPLRQTGVLAHPFDRHVMKGEITLDALCSWVGSIEPPESDDITLNLGLGARFASEYAPHV